MYWLEQLMGDQVAPAGPNPLDPAQVPDAQVQLAVVPHRAVAGEPGSGVRTRTPTALAQNPVTWLVGTLALGIALYAYGSGRV